MATQHQIYHVARRGPAGRLVNKRQIKRVGLAQTVNRGHLIRYRLTVGNSDNIDPGKILCAVIQNGYAQPVKLVQHQLMTLYIAFVIAGYEKDILLYAFERFQVIQREVTAVEQIAANQHGINIHRDQMITDFGQMLRRM